MPRAGRRWRRRNSLRRGGWWRADEGVSAAVRLGREGPLRADERTARGVGGATAMGRRGLLPASGLLSPVAGDHLLPVRGYFLPVDCILPVPEDFLLASCQRGVASCQRGLGGGIAVEGLLPARGLLPASGLPSASGDLLRPGRWNRCGWCRRERPRRSAARGAPPARAGRGRGARGGGGVEQACCCRA